jgi:hypothetical protein
MKPSVYALGVLGLLLVGCIPLQQTDIKGGQGYDGFGWYNETGYGLLWIGPGNVKNTITVVDAKSYALGPNGIRYGVRSELHLFDVQQKYAYVRDEIHFLDAKGGQVSRLGNGVWQFSFTFVKDGKEESRTFTRKLWTFNYVPIIDGPPN